MSRYIDADKIIYTWLIDNDGKEHDGVTLQSVIDKMPTADVVEVVRCKDCIYRFGSSCKWREDETPDPDDYCSIGENYEQIH